MSEPLWSGAAQHQRLFCFSHRPAWGARGPGRGPRPQPTQGTFQTKCSARKLVGVGLPLLGISQLRASHSSFTSCAVLGRVVFSFSSSLLAFFGDSFKKIHILSCLYLKPRVFAHFDPSNSPTNPAKRVGVSKRPCGA